ncbi:MAG: glycosyltransferase [Flavihumibacter sp.]|nr:glycosyltransferase [Flavihumibacter sp.]
MKIISLVPYTIFPAKVGGQKGIALFTEYLAKEAPVVMVTVKSNSPSFASGYKMYNCIGNGAFRYINLFLFFTLRRIIKKEGATHLIIEHPYWGWLGILLKWFAGVQLAVHSHNIESTRWKSLGKWWWKILWRYEKATHAAAQYNFFIHDDDRNYAITQFQLNAAKCITVTYGIDWSETPSATERQYCRQQLQQQHGIATNEKILLFNGALDYAPNLQAVKTIINSINPLLLQTGFAYRIIICGRGLPAAMNSLKDYADKNIVFAGFVDDITVYFKGADIFINPVIEGGGIKTKLVEALGYGTAAVSTTNGAIGVNKDDAGDLLTIVADDDWPAFVEAVIKNKPAILPDHFFKKFYWGHIAKTVVAFLK